MQLEYFYKRIRTPLRAHLKSILNKSSDARIVIFYNKNVNSAKIKKTCDSVYSMAKTDSENKHGHTYLQWTFAVLANTVTLSYGLECGWISPITKTLQSDTSPAGEPLTTAQISWIASPMSMAAVVGVSIFIVISERYGNKIGIILVAFPQVVSWALRICYTTNTTLLIARIISGLAAGGVFNVVPMYVKEISEDKIRGKLGTLLVLTQNTGIFIMYVIGAYFDYYTVMYIAISIPVVTAVIMIKAPNSPAFLVKQDKIEEATAALALIRGLNKEDTIVADEIERLRIEHEQFRALPNISFRAILNDRSWRRGLILILMTFTCQGINGAFAIITFASAILVSTGVEINISPELQTLSIPFVMIISSLTLTIIVERCGRKVLLSGAYFLTAIAMATLAAVVLLQKGGWNVPSWVPILAMVLVVSMYSGGVAPLPYIMMTEMFNFQVRAIVMGRVVTYAWFLSSSATAVYSPISSAFGQYIAFIVYGTFNLIGAVFVFTFMPETKGKSDNEIREELSGMNKHNKVLQS